MKRILSATAFLLLTAVSAIASPAVAVIDSETKTLSLIDLATGAVASKLQLSDPPTDLLAAPDGKKLIVLSRGPGSETFWTASFRPKARASVTLVDAKTLKLIQRTELGWALADATISKDGKTLVVLSPGVTGKPAEIKPAEVFSVDLSNGAVRGSVALDRPATGFALAPDEKTGIVYFEAGRRAKPPTELRFIDMSAMKDVGRVTIDAQTKAPVLTESGDHLYLVDQQHSKGTLYIVSISERQIAASIPTGGNPTIGAVDHDSGRIFMTASPLEKGDKKVRGEMKVIKGKDVVATVPFEHRPWGLRITPDKRTAWLLGSSRIASVSMTDYSAQPAIEVWEGPADMMLTPDGSRAVTHHSWADGCCKMSVVDLNEKKRLTSFVTGSKGLRFAQALLAVGATVASYQSGKSAAESKGQSSFYYTVYTPRPGAVPRGPLAIRPDGKIGYALDTQTGYVTYADLASGERAGNISIGSGPQELVMLDGGKLLAAVADTSVTFIDTTSNTEVNQVKLSGEVREFATSPNGKHVVVLGKEKLIVYDVVSRKTVAEVSGVKRPIDLVFLE